MRREITEGQRAWLVDELAAWREEGLVDEALARAVLGMYQTPDDLGRARQNRAMGILTNLGALLVGLGVLLLIGYNWELMHPAVKVGLILLVLVTVQSVGLHLRFVRRKPDAADVVFFFGALIYGAGIWLIGQIFHLSASDGSAFWWWAAGVLPFALAGRSLALHALYAALLAAWVGVELIGFPGLGAWLFRRWWMLPNGAYSLPLMLAPGMAWAYRHRSSRVLGLYLPVIVWWALLQPTTGWHAGNFPVYFLGGLGALLLVAGELHGASSPMAMPYRLYGGGLVGGALVPISFHSFNDQVVRWVWARGDDPLHIVVLPLLIVAGAAAIVAVSAALDRDGGPFADRLLARARRATTPLGLAGLMVVLGLWRAFVGEPLVPTLAANAAMLALAYWLMQHGLRDDRGVPFAAGTTYFLLWVVIRYIDLFGDFGGMLGGALMFFLCGACLFGLTAYWRRRGRARLGGKPPVPSLDPWNEPEAHHVAP